MDNKVLVYGSGTCPTCLMVKKFLTEHHVDFVEKDINDNKNKQEFSKLGYTSIPLVIYGPFKTCGFNTKDLQNLVTIYNHK